MTRKILALALVLALTVSLAACTASVAAPGNVGGQSGVVQNTNRSGGSAGNGAQITEEQAQRIALEHANLTEEQVTGLQVSYDVDDGVPEYDVEFRYDGWEYEYEIHAETGDIRSYDRDD